jgi:ATP-dependent DNA helicase RecG
VLKAIRYPGDKIHATDYLDTEDFSGPLPKLFEGALSFVMRNLRKVQAGRGVNAPGLPEIPEAVFEELLVNALVHRDYLVSAPIRLFVFDNRIEILSPGHLPNNLTVDKILAGNSNIRNQILVSYVAKGLMPYHGLGSGIKRALEKWPTIDFADDHDGCLFTATVYRKAVEELDLAHRASEVASKGDMASGKRRESVGKASGKILVACRENRFITIYELAELIGITERSVQRNIHNLQKNGLLRRIGGRKEGHWQVLE